MQYKFENFKDPRFPLYCSTQRGRGQLAVPHFHNAYELIKIVDGGVTVFIDTNEIPVSKGDVIFIPPRCIHATYSTREDTVTFNVTFERSLIDETVLPPEIDDILNKDAITQFVFRGDEHAVLDGCIERIRHIYYDGSTTYKIDILAATLTLLSCVINRYRPYGEQDDGGRRLRPVLQYIKENSHKKILLSDLSNILHVCDDHLIRLFKSYTNKSPVKYILDLRVENAMRLLIDTDRSIADIAAEVGFSSPNYMAKLFKDTINLTPNQYRKRKQAR